MSSESSTPDLRPTGAAPAGLDYEIVRLIGRGAYGEVWLVRDRTGAYFACKVVYRESFNNDRPYEREYAGIQKFEPVSTASESQLHILHVGRHDEAGYFYYLLELADDANTGREIDPARYVPRTLRTDIETRGRLPLNESVHIGLALSAALEHLHRHGLIHRDIKPTNIIFVNGIPKLADIGLVTDLDLSISYVGTEGYIPPEGPTSGQADVYALGKVLYEISTGRDRLDFPELPTELGEAVDRHARLEFNAIVTRACQNDPRKRYRSAQELHADLALLQSGRSVRRHRAARRRWVWGAQACAAVAIIAGVLMGTRYLRSPAESSAPAADAVKAQRIPLPNAAELARSQKEIEEAYRSKLTNASPEAMASTAGELIQQSATVTDPAHELATLRVAANLAKKAERYDLSLAACDKVAARFITNVLPFKIALLANGTLPPRTSRAASGLAEACVATGFAAIAADNYEIAQQAAAIASAAATNSSQSYLAAEVEFLTNELARCAAAYRRLDRYITTLRTQPGDPAANLALGEFLCFVKNDWNNGLPMMAHGNDERLKTVLDVELNHKPGRPRDMALAGDLWWDVASQAPEAQKLNYQRRARHWYCKALARVRGTEKEALKQRVSERLAAVTPPVMQIHIVARVEGTDHIGITADSFRWVSSRGSENHRINWLSIGELKRAGVQEFANAGNSRLLPEDVDFASAKLTINHVALRRRARASLETGEDHARLTMTDPANGMSEFDVTIRFGY